MSDSVLSRWEWDSLSLMSLCTNANGSCFVSLVSMFHKVPNHHLKRCLKALHRLGLWLNYVFSSRIRSFLSTHCYLLLFVRVIELLEFIT